MYLRFSKLFVFWSNAECFTLFNHTQQVFVEIKVARGLKPCILVGVFLRFIETFCFRLYTYIY